MYVENILLLIFIAGLGANFKYDEKNYCVINIKSGLIIRILSVDFSKFTYFHLLTRAIIAYNCFENGWCGTFFLYHPVTGGPCQLRDVIRIFYCIVVFY